MNKSWMEGYHHPLSNSNYYRDFLYLLSISLSDLILHTVELEALTPPPALARCVAT